METHHDVRLRALKADISARLKSVCTDWPEGEFEAMVERLARITMKYTSGSDIVYYDRRSTDRIVSELKDLLERSQAVRGKPIKKRSRRPRKSRDA